MNKLEAIDLIKNIKCQEISPDIKIFSHFLIENFSFELEPFLKETKEGTLLLDCDIVHLEIMSKYLSGYRAIDFKDDYRFLNYKNAICDIHSYCMIINLEQLLELIIYITSDKFKVLTFLL